MAVLCTMWEFSSLTRDQSHTPCTGSAVLTTGPPGRSHDYILVFISMLYIFMLLISLLSFYLKNSSQHFLQDRSSGDKLPQLCLGKSLPLLHLWRTTLPYWVFSFGSFILPALWEYLLSLSWPAWFLLRNPLIVLWGFLFKLQAFFFAPYNIFFV